MMRFNVRAKSVVEAGAAFVKTGTAGPGRQRRSHTSGLLTPSCKVSVASKRQEGSEIFRPSRP